MPLSSTPHADLVSANKIVFHDDVSSTFNAYCYSHFSLPKTKDSDIRKPEDADTAEKIIDEINDHTVTTTQEDDKGTFMMYFYLIILSELKSVEWSDGGSYFSTSCVPSLSHHWISKMICENWDSVIEIYFRTPVRNWNNISFDLAHFYLLILYVHTFTYCSWKSLLCVEEKAKKEEEGEAEEDEEKPENDEADVKDG